MRLLLVNTCGAEGTVGLAEDAAVIAEEELAGRGASESLVPAIRTIFGRFGWTVRDLAAVAVVIGPGSFTGMRVGLSVAKGLCEAGGVPMVAMSRLELVAEGAFEADRMALLDAGRGEYYCGVYRGGQENFEALVTGEEAHRWARTVVEVVTCESRVQESLRWPVRLVREPRAEEMLPMASRRIAAGAWSDVALTDAHYLRRTDAELLAKARAGGTEAG